MLAGGRGSVCLVLEFYEDGSYEANSSLSSVIAEEGE